MGRGILLGGVPGVAPAHITILGGGVVGANAAKIAAGLLETKREALRRRNTKNLPCSVRDSSWKWSSVLEFWLSSVVRRRWTELPPRQHVESRWHDKDAEYRNYVTDLISSKYYEKGVPPGLNIPELVAESIEKLRSPSRATRG